MGTDAAVEVNLLGPLEVRVRGALVPIGSPRTRSLLAALALDAGRPVPVDDLIDAVWSGARPDNPRRALQLNITRLRALLGGDPVTTHPGGYRLDARTDVSRFRALTEAAEREWGHAGTASAALGEALALWRGEPLSGVESERLLREAAPLREEWWRAVERRAEADLSRGRHDEVAAELRELAAGAPLHERLWGQLITALHRGGRRAEALAAYQALRGHLADELGVDPSEEIQRLHAEVLTGPQRTVPVPRQLPPDPPGFCGRAAELSTLDGLLNGGRGTPVAVVAGAAGVGKTALAARWARTVADRFPDGQLWINLRGYHPDRPLRADQALTRFLRALGVPGPRLPSDLDDQVGLYRSMMDGRRMLVVLDNAAGPDQVRPLLPGAPGSLVLVTSREELPGLVAAAGARPLALDLLTEREARELLARRVGAERVAAEPGPVERIVARCARLPLALAIVAARAAARPSFPLAALADELDGARHPLDALATGDPVVDLRVVFSWSYAKAGTDAARLFRLLSLHPGPDLDAAAAAALLGRPAARTRPLLGELTRAHLVVETAPGRYGFHDLLRGYAAEQAELTDQAERTEQAELTEQAEGTKQAEGTEQAALRRMLDHYLSLADRAADALEPYRWRAGPGHGPSHVDLADERRAMAWFSTEHQVLLALAETATSAGLDPYAWRLAWTLAGFLDRRGYWDDLIAVERLAVDAALRAGDRDAEQRSRRLLGEACRRRGRLGEAHEQLGRALELARALGDHTEQGHNHICHALVSEVEGDHRAALDRARLSLAEFEAGGDAHGRATALNSIGWYHAQLGDPTEGLRWCREALKVFVEQGDRHGQGITLDSIGHCHHRLGDLAAAAESYADALTRYGRDGDRHNRAEALTSLGDVHRDAGDVAAARDAWRRAEEILTDLGHPRAAAVRARLGRSGGTAPAG